MYILADLNWAGLRCPFLATVPPLGIADQNYRGVDRALEVTCVTSTESHRRADVGESFPHHLGPEWPGGDFAMHSGLFLDELGRWGPERFVPRVLLTVKAIEAHRWQSLGGS